MFTIKHAAAALGVPAPTLRAWERRYRVVVPGRSDGGYRVYDEADLAAFADMKALVDQGWSPKTAADRVRGRAAPPAGVGDLLRAADALDPGAIDAVVESWLADAGPEDAIDDLLMPALAEIGARWAAGELPVAAEHLVAAAVQRRLGAKYAAAGYASSAPVHAGTPAARGGVLVGCVPGSRHELGLLAFASCLRRRGVRTLHAGADVPVPDWVTLASAHRPAWVVLAVHGDAELPGAAMVADALARLPAAPRVAVGGSHQDQVCGGIRRLGHGIVEAASWLAADLARRRTDPTPTPPSRKRSPT